MFPLIGGRKVEHLLANLEALDISLSDEQMKELEAASELDLGFPGSFIVSFISFVFSGLVLICFCSLGYWTRGWLDDGIGWHR